MTYRDPPQYRSWNVSALGLKTEKPDNDLSYKDRQRPRRESWSPPRGRATRGRGTWGIDNRPQNRRRNTVPNSSQEFNHHAENYESDKQLEGNPILEEPRNLSASPVNDRYDLKIKENNDNDYNDYNDESPFLNRKKHSSDNLYRPPKSRSTSYNKDWKSNSSSDDGSQSRGGYSNGTSKKYEPENYKPQRNNSWEREPTNNDPDQMWVHDKFESLETENVTLIINSKDKKDASTQVSPSDINNEIKTINNEIAKETNEPKSPEDSGQSVISAEHPKELSIKLADLTLKDSNVESTMTQTSASEAEPEIISEVTPEVDPVTPKDEESTVLINLDEDDNADKQTIQPKISEDVFFVDWIGYQKTLFEEECKCTMEQPSKMSNLRKLDTTLKDFDSLI